MIPFLFLSLLLGCAEKTLAPTEVDPNKSIAVIAKAISDLPKILAKDPNEDELDDPPVFADSLYGPSELGARILFHDTQVAYIKPKKLQSTFRIEKNLLDENKLGLLTNEQLAELVAQKKLLAPKNLASKEKLKKNDDGLGLANEVGKEHMEKKDAPNIDASSNKLIHTAKEGVLIAVSKIRRPRPVKTPLTKAKIDSKGYLAALGITSVYDLSAYASELARPTFLFWRPQDRNLSKVWVGKKSLSYEQWNEMIQTACQMFGLDPKFIAAIIKVESDFDPFVVSSAGAQGAMQIMPATQKDLGLIDPFDPRSNIQAGCAYIHQLLLKYGSTELALAAYNAGPGAVDKAQGIPPFAETKNYVRRVMQYWLGDDQALKYENDADIKLKDRQNSSQIKSKSEKHKAKIAS